MVWSIASFMSQEDLKKMSEKELKAAKKAEEDAVLKKAEEDAALKRAEEDEELYHVYGGD